MASYTPEQKQAIFDLDHSLVVTAGAGSGKTRVLVGRYVNILEEQAADWNMEKANTTMANFLTSYPDQIDAVFAHNDQMAEGAGMACQAAGVNDIIIWGANGETKALEYIEGGIITGTVYTDCYDQGATALRLLMMYIGSDIDISDWSATPVIKMPPITVTIDNVATITDDMRW